MADFHAENRYFRIFPLGAFGIAGDFEVARVQVGIREVLGSRSRTPVAVRLHTLAGEPLVTNLTQIAEELIDLPVEVPTQVEVPFSNAVVPMGRALVVEVFIPGDLERRDDSVPGMDGNGASSPGFPAPACRAEPAPIPAAPDVRMIMTVYGRER
jgi:hypothetical protein